MKAKVIKRNFGPYTNSKIKKEKIKWFVCSDLQLCRVLTGVSHCNPG